ncbi:MULTISPECIES: metalloregulator ArsR/SmtB family transcription factor [Lacrimispora]|jgi:ArsR family transcriptional regulator|uniref:ArsR/SmtB family transcription factor n=1 Tax=Lacrimispora TaxID=2719231 RepID=UPI000BE3F192|nr:metalloregulator ArsR/SmtB family transcription factor [Lacrimispora amygdalina]MDK2966189.1 ArsR family transcriptional regulator, arsenate/arsenite/antimonite-responsive transcriptional [Lacrimispora sp.]
MDLHADYAPVFKALGDATRLKIIEMLSCGELCACDILECFEITQPTLSYHMKILTDCGLVKNRKEGSWIRYSNNTDLIEHIKIFWDNITTEQEDCICKCSKEDNRCD